MGEGDKKGKNVCIMAVASNIRYRLPALFGRIHEATDCTTTTGRRSPPILLTTDVSTREVEVNNQPPPLMEQLSPPKSQCMALRIQQDRTQAMHSVGMAAIVKQVGITMDYGPRTWQTQRDGTAQGVNVHLQLNWRWAE